MIVDTLIVARICNEEFLSWWRHEVAKGSLGLERRVNRESAFRAGVEAAIRALAPPASPTTLAEPEAEGA
jgi:hypothetical protein